MKVSTAFVTMTMMLTVVSGASAQAPGPGGPQRTPAQRAAAAQAEREKMMAMPRPVDAVDSVWLEELTWLEVRDAIRAGKTTIIVATGGMEQNGPYLATGKHNYVNRAGCEAIARKLGNALCAPNVAFVPEGSFEPPTGAMMYPGSIGVSDATFAALLSDIANSFRVTGFENVILIGDSGGNQRGMKDVASTLAPKWAATKARIHYIADYYDKFNQVVEYAEKTFGWKQVPDGSHDDALITAIIMTVNPDHVRMPQRTAKGLTKTNAIDLAPVTTAIEVGRAIVNRRAEITVDAIRKAIAASPASQR
ncbi:MAG: creatininase family protein [Planctomycetota bacterium]|nr:creatininase family protein [Planctomycetota bacterium]